MSTMYYSPTSGQKLDIKNMKLPRFAKDWLNYLLVELNLAPRTVFDYSVSITVFLRWVKSLETGTQTEDFKDLDISDVPLDTVASLSRNDIYEFLSFCATELENSANSRACKIAAIRSMYNFLKNKMPGSCVTENPTEDIASPKKEKPLPKFLSLEEARSLLSAVEGEAKDRDFCMILWFLSCGMRLSELVAIDMKDVKGSTLRVYGKGRKERILPLNEACMDALENYLIERKSYHRVDGETALFVSKRTGKRLTPRRVEQIVEDNLARSGLQGNGYSVHKLRHSTATLLYSQTRDLLAVKELLGHGSVKSTEVYTHMQEQSAISKAIEVFGEKLVSQEKPNLTKGKST